MKLKMIWPFNLNYREIRFRHEMTFEERIFSKYHLNSSPSIFPEVRFNTTDPIFSFYPIVSLLGYVSEMIICVKLSVYVLVVVSHFVLSHF